MAKFSIAYDKEGNRYFAGYAIYEVPTAVLKFRAKKGTTVIEGADLNELIENIYEDLSTQKRGDAMRSAFLSKLTAPRGPYGR